MKDFSCHGTDEGSTFRKVSRVNARKEVVISVTPCSPSMARTNWLAPTLNTRRLSGILLTLPSTKRDPTTTSYPSSILARNAGMSPGLC